MAFIWRENMLGNLCEDKICSEKCTVLRQIMSKIDIQANGGYCVYYPSNILPKTLDLLKIGDITEIFPIFSWGAISHVMRLDQSRASKKYLMDCNA